MTSTETGNDPRAELDAFHERRRRAVTSRQGNLALVNTQWITGDPDAAAQPVWGVPGLWSPLPKGVSGLKVTAAASEGIVVDGELVDGETIVAGKDSINPSSIVFDDTTTGYVIASDDGDYALRVWDAASEAIGDFGSIDAFPYDPEWVVEANYTPIEGGSIVGIEHLKDEGRTRDKVVPASITFSKDGVDYDLAAFQDDGGLLLVFADATNGDSSYSVGRFMRVTPGQNGTITLDFNRAYLPPCAFSYNFNCPMPPAQNRFAVPIEAGEKNVLARNGELLH
ncbi:DUF1684 domain-containing protein [Compostimonas suwonensis]|uniref:DUF1684 domain-containing protein n=1 Tax=Compostimonas suwonensis TaxID=1048394 RepID=A0A2M9BZ16_9MICO|nr:DUF1684 domain-containing protein [Compostimonas suwonensis]PJJ63310.1 hypothetical protein CLV54_0973 [Compostimonas suwonensis]